MISIIICSRDPQKFSRVSAMYEKVLAAESHEIVHVPDATGLCEGYNRGLDRSRGEVLIFSHDDVAFLAPDFFRRLLGHLQHADLLGVAGTTRVCAGYWLQSGPPYLYGQLIHQLPTMTEVTIFDAPTRRVDGIQALDGVFLCCRRPVAESLRFDAQAFPGFHLYDVDFSFRAHRAGYRLAVCNDLDLVHQSGGNPPADLAEQYQRFAQKHGPALAPFVSRRFTLRGVLVQSLQEGVELLRPPHWAD